jgi:superfamily II DNA or RNA helicase
MSGTQTHQPRQLRDYQEEARANVWADWTSGVRRTVVVHATGLGKTDIIAKLCVDEALAGGTAMVLAERSEPLDQFTERVAEYAPIPVGRIQAQRNEIHCKILAASIQTIRNPKRMAMIDAANNRPTLLIIDECHHGLADSYLDVVEWAGCFEAATRWAPDTAYDYIVHVNASESRRNARLVGFTATLIRGDGQLFDGLFTNVADVKGMDWAIEHGWLVEPYGRTIRVRYSLDHIKRVSGDLSASGVGGVIEQAAHDIVKAWEREASDRITIAYAPTIASADVLLDAFTARGHAAEMVIGSTPHEDRKLVYKRLAAGDTRVLVNVGVATEAFDCPPVSCILIARMTENPGLYEQMVGRGLRQLWGSDGKPLIDPHTNQPVKPDCLVLDVVGITQKFQLVTLIALRRNRHRTPRMENRPVRRRWWQRKHSMADIDLHPRQSIASRIWHGLFGK